MVGEVFYFPDELKEIWGNRIISISSISFLASVPEKELKKVFLGTCYCCPEFPITPVTDMSEECEGNVCCNRKEETIPFSTGTCPTCGGNISYSNSSGMINFPKISVDTSSVALIIRHVPVGYQCNLGKDIKITLTFNSDLSHSGLFGNSWHSNLETHIRENPDGSVTVTRTNGHEDTFTYSGGEYYPPVGYSDKLTKNPDGTFTLEFPKSHTKYIYDTHENGGKILAIKDKNGNTITFNYDENGILTSIVDAAGRTTEIQTDSEGRIIKIIDPIGREANFVYDDSGDLVEVQDIGGNTFSYTYDENHNITSLTTPKGTYNFEYGSYSSEILIRKIIDPLGNEYEIDWEGVTYIKGPRGYYRYYTADWSEWPYYGDTTTIEDAEGHLIIFTYDDNRNRTQVTDKRGYVTSYTYDENHNMTSKTDPLGNTWTYTYDSNNNLTSITDPKGNTTTYQYDSNGNLTKIIYPDGSTTTYTYDSKGLLTSVTDANGNTTTYQYDSYGNLIKIIDPLGYQTTFTYDAIGRKISQTDAKGRTTYYTYDNLDRIIKITHPDGTYREFTYDCCHLTQIKDENGNITQYEYDALGRLIKVIDANGNETQYTYDSEGNLTSITDPNGNTTTFEYDSLNRLIKKTYPDGSYETYQYDENGNLILKIKPDGKKIHYVYDALNRLKKIYVENIQ